MAAGLEVIGPYAPALFKETNLGDSTVVGSLSKAMHDDLPSGTIVSCEPVVVLGNVFLIVYHSS